MEKGQLITNAFFQSYMVEEIHFLSVNVFKKKQVSSIFLL